MAARRVTALSFHGFFHIKSGELLREAASYPLPFGGRIIPLRESAVQQESWLFQAQIGVMAEVREREFIAPGDDETEFSSCKIAPWSAVAVEGKPAVVFP